MKRPWWLIVIQSEGLVSTVAERTEPGERIFVVQGQPVVQSLVGIIWGPVAALGAVAGCTALAIFLGVNQQGWGLRAGFIGLFLLAPAMAWGAVYGLLRPASRRYVEALRAARTEVYTLCLRQKRGELVYHQTPTDEAGRVVPYEAIRRAKVTTPVGAEGLQLTLDTTEGPLILLDERVGTQAQKQDLAHVIQMAVDDYSSMAASKSTSI